MSTSKEHSIYDNRRPKDLDDTWEFPMNAKEISIWIGIAIAFISGGIAYGQQSSKVESLIAGQEKMEGANKELRETIQGINNNLIRFEIQLGTIGSATEEGKEVSKQLQEMVQELLIRSQ